MKNSDRKNSCALQIESLIEKNENRLRDKTIVYSEPKVQLTQQWVLEGVIKDLKNII